MKKIRIFFYILAGAIIILTLVSFLSTPTVAQQPQIYEPQSMKGAGPDQITSAANQYLQSYGAVRGPNQPKMIRTLSVDELEKRLDLQLPSLDQNQSYILVILNGQFNMTGFPGNSDSPHPTSEYIAIAFEENTGEVIMVMSLDNESLIQTALGNQN